MKRLNTLAIVLIGVLWSVICSADSLIITFQSGRTQQVTLDEKIEAVENIQAKTSEGDQVKSATRYLYTKGTAEKELEPPKNGRAQPGTEKKSRWKWAPPKIGE
jgi:hypothetical protein